MQFGDKLTDAEKIQVWRNRLGLSQTEAAKLLGMSRATLSRIELGEVMPKMLELIIQLWPEHKTVHKTPGQPDYTDNELLTPEVRYQDPPSKPQPSPSNKTSMTFDEMEKHGMILKRS